MRPASESLQISRAETDSKNSEAGKSTYAHLHTSSFAQANEKGVR
jgi:hypothetical protein